MTATLNSLLKIRKISQQARFYPRWSHRRPLKVYASEEEYEKIENNENKIVSEKNNKQESSLFDKYSSSNENSQKIKWTHPASDDSINFDVKLKRTKLKPITASKQVIKKTSVDMLETVIDSEGNFVYTKMSNFDKRAGTILTQVKNKKEQEKADIILLEGKRLIKDALLSSCQLKYILFSRTKEIEYLQPFLPKLGAQLYKMPYKEMQMWSDLTTSPGIMGIFKVPNVENYKPAETIPLTVICDNIREPGNLGTVLRICAGVGAHVILTKGCVNLWDTKVLRGAAGAHFKLNIQNSLEWTQIEDKIASDSNVYIADNKVVSDAGDSNDNLEEIVQNTPLLPYYGVDFKHLAKIVLIVGGETEGISLQSYKLASKLNGARLNIPLSNSIDSLNVGAALGIIAFEIKRQLVKL